MNATATTGGTDMDGPRKEHPRRLLVLAAVAISVLVVGVALRALAEPAGRAEQAGAAPAISLPDLAEPSTTRTLADLRGRPVVVNLFASWCLPCQRELTVLQDASMANPDVAFLGIDHQDSRRAGLEMLREAGVTYPAAHDPKGTTAAAYRAVGMPTTIFITRQGTVAATHLGELTRPQLDTLIQDARNGSS